MNNKTKVDTHINRVRLGNLSKDLESSFTAGVSVLLVGRPGVGKTAIVRDAWAKVAQKIGGDPEVVVDTPACSDPTDYKGLPCIVEGKAVFDPIGLLRKLLKAEVPTLFFLDDLGQASESIQKALQHIIWAREVEGKKIPDCVRFVGATNSRTDRAGVCNLISPLVSRFDAVIHAEADLDHWTGWAAGAGIDPRILSFLQFKPDCFSQEPGQDFATKFGCPRAYEAVSKLLGQGLSSPAWLTGALGSAGVDLHGFISVYEGLADLPDKILASPKTAKVPDIKKEPEVLWALLGALVSRLKTPKHADSFFAYLPRLPQAFEVFGVKLFDKLCPKLTSTQAFTDWTIHRAHLVGLK